MIPRLDDHADTQNWEYLTHHLNFQIFYKDDVDPCFIAIDQNDIVRAIFEFVETDDGYQLAHMNVSQDYKGLGIGKAIIEEAVNLWSTFKLPSTDSRQNYYYIEDGLQFIISCFNHNILTTASFKHPLE